MPVDSPNGKKSVPEGLWTKCRECEQIIFNKELEDNLKICPKCGFHFLLNARERLRMLTDEGSEFVEYDPDILPTDPMGFVDLQPYTNRISICTKKTGMQEAILTGEGVIDGIRAAFGIMEFGFLGGSMGSVVGEKISLLADTALEKRLPLVIVSSSGGARMQESILSLMQMAKTAGAIGMYQRGELPYISVVTNPTSGGVTASFSMLGDVIIAEPGALVAFAGPRVIEQTIKVQLPEGFQSSEFCLEHGMIDMIVDRRELKQTISRLMRFFSGDAAE